MNTQAIMIMEPNVTLKQYKDTIYSCRVLGSKYCEEMVVEHMLVYLYSGALDLIEKEGKKHTVKKGDFFFVPKNHRLTKVKRSVGNEPFYGLFVLLKSSMLRKVLSLYRMNLDKNVTYKGKGPYVLLDRHPFLEDLFRSLRSYFEGDGFPSDALMENKIQEAALTLLELRPDLAPVLFDSSKPWKVDLRSFMENNYTSDLDLNGFAHFSGRSLSGFKQEFEEIYRISPMRWIVSRRLEEARERIEEAGESPSNVYLEVGFKNLSHFSTAYKKKYGHSPKRTITI